MKIFFIIIKILFIYSFLISSGVAKESNYFKKGIELFQKKEFDKSKTLFEQDIVKNCKDEDLKTAIRKSKTPLEALDKFLIIWKESN